MTTSTDPALLHTRLSMLVTALWFEIDHHEGSTASSYFTPDAELTIVGRTVRGTAGIDAFYRARADRGPRVSRHLATNLHVLRQDERHVDALSALVLYAADGEPPVPRTAPLLVADVHDRFVRVDERWLIASRRILERFLPSDAVLTVPIGEAENP